MYPWMVPGENAALAAQELNERITDLANDEFEAGELIDEFLDEFEQNAAEYYDEALSSDWKVVSGRVGVAAPKLFERIRAKVVLQRIETLKER